MSLDATRGRAMLWQPSGNGCEALDLGTLPGEEGATVAGIDDLHRVFGTSSTWTVSVTPFVWTPAQGMSSLVGAGSPAESPVAVSPGGTFATTSLSCHCGDPAGVEAVAFLVDGVTAGGRILDRTTGVLTSYVIPQPRR